jgi:Na+-driven multidrug efflux pump
MVSFIIGLGAGSSILIGQAFGAKNTERLKAVIGTTISFTFLLGVVLALIGGIFTWDLLRLIGTPSNVIAVTVHYARILFWSLPVLFVYFAYTTFMRGTGDSKTPFYLLIISTTINLIMLPILVFGWIGFP